ncbi:chemotaxis protein CheA [Nocardioides sp. GY 10113]|uniref:chemotaxis protein CheA n=1 Tax=Nocardioides sp. GY 10113 TaxID=2569761 RepID=UPI0010A8C916|nr:chemotaxis protein CheA [Nocardioides sp. GY 10113]TIC85965.1 chemotaxis protein CheA [Nocardioides sp. GY 10113]
MDDDAEIIAEFLVESYENLDQLDRDLVELEQQPDSRALLSSIFRTIHTIKGTSGFLAFDRLERLTHVGETLLARLRDGERTMNPPIAEALLTMVDVTRALLGSIERTGRDADPAVDVAPVVAVIEALLAGEAVEPDATEPDATEPDVAEPDVAEPDVADPEVAAAVTAEPVVAEPAVTEPAVAEPAVAEPAAAEPAPAAPAAAPEEDRDRRTVADSSIRVDVDLLDNLVDLVGELVLTRNQILQGAGAGQEAELARASQRLNLVASELQEAVMRTRMQPIGQVWSKMPRIVRDLSHQLGRDVELVMEGRDTELDRSLLEALSGPLTHLVRNSLDHGIEPPAARLAAGKPARGTLLLRASHESGQVIVEITDDGKGMDPERIGAVAVERGVITRDQLASMDTRDVLGLIFRPGFSTATEVTNVSGRGVGMDVVRTNIERIGGSVDLDSEVGRGTTVRVRIPLTLAIIPALVVEEDGERYAIPQANLVELVRLEGEDLRRDVEVLAGTPVLRLRGDLLPLVSLAGALELSTAEDPSTAETITVVVVQADALRFGLTVAQVHDTQEIVVKPIGRQLKSIPVYAGATILGDGRVSLILDVAGLARDSNVEKTHRQVETERRSEEEVTPILVLQVGQGQRAAIPLADVARLEEIDASRIEYSGASEVAQYRGGILPLLRLAPMLGFLDPAAGAEESVTVIVHEHAGGLVGLVVGRVVDVADVALDPSPVGARPGVVGTVVVHDKVTDLIDLDAVLRTCLGDVAAGGTAVDDFTDLLELTHGLDGDLDGHLLNGATR